MGSWPKQALKGQLTGHLTCPVPVSGSNLHAYQLETSCPFLAIFGFAKN